MSIAISIDVENITRIEMAYAINVIFPKEQRSLEKIAATKSTPKFKEKHRIIKQWMNADG